ncbi:MAG: hypothetical protein CR985_00230 [Flavobacteriales bacterium]|nr:MAG: hypothetical protein CR985_00230 [Flavobacteriales bacterium]
MDLTRNYKNDSDEQIIYKRLVTELKEWQNNLQYWKEEADNLAAISKKYLNDFKVAQSFEKYKTALSNFNSEIHRANNALENINECDSIQCDMYYLNEHSSVEKNYYELIKNFRILKKSLYAKMINKKLS